MWTTQITYTRSNDGTKYLMTTIKRIYFNCLYVETIHALHLLKRKRSILSHVSPITLRYFYFIYLCTACIINAQKPALVSIMTVTIRFITDDVWRTYGRTDKQVHDEGITLTVLPSYSLERRNSNRYRCETVFVQILTCVCYTTSQTQ